MASKCILLLFTICLVHCSHCWIFNDINARNLEDNILEEFDDELTPEDLARLRFSLIYPGTKWCGPGNIADDYDDLGTSQAADACCREHDNCPETIEAGETKHNLTNDAYYTKLSCDCDETFRKCLRSADTQSSTTIGLLYFNVIGTQCFRKDYLITGCIKKGGWLNTKCLEYSYDENSEPAYQWFDVPNYVSVRRLARTRHILERPLLRHEKFSKRDAAYSASE